MGPHGTPGGVRSAGGRLPAGEAGGWLGALFRADWPFWAGRSLVAPSRDSMHRHTTRRREVRIRVSAMSGTWLHTHGIDDGKHRTEF